MSTTAGKEQGGEWISIESLLQPDVVASNGTKDDLSSSCDSTSESSGQRAANIVQVLEDTPDVATTPTTQSDPNDVHYTADKADRSDTDDDLPSLDELLKSSQSLASRAGQLTARSANATMADAAGRFEDTRVRAARPVSGTSVENPIELFDEQPRIALHEQQLDKGRASPTGASPAVVDHVHGSLGQQFFAGAIMVNGSTSDSDDGRISTGSSISESQKITEGIGDNYPGVEALGSTIPPHGLAPTGTPGGSSQASTSSMSDVWDVASSRYGSPLGSTSGRVLVDPKQEFEFESIMDVKVIGGRLVYMLRWPDSTVDASDLVEAGDALRKFYAINPQKRQLTDASTGYSKTTKKMRIRE